MSKVINLDNLKRFYAKCKEHFADKDDTTRAINEVGDDVAEALHLINGEQSAFHVGNVVQETGDSTTNVMSQDAVTKALASAGGGVKKQFDEVYETTLEQDAVVSYTTEKNIMSIMVEIVKPSGATSASHRINLGSDPSHISGVITSSYNANARFVITRFGDGYVVMQRTGNNAQESYMLASYYAYLSYNFDTAKYFTTLTSLPQGTKIKLSFIYE